MIGHNNQEHYFYCKACDTPVNYEEIDDYLLRFKVICLLYRCPNCNTTWKVNKPFTTDDFLKTENRNE